MVPVLTQRKIFRSIRVTGVGGGGASTPPKLFIWKQSGQNHLKSGQKSAEIWAKCVNAFAKSLYVL